DSPIIASGWLDNNSRIHDARGLGVDLLDIVANTFNFRYELYVPADGQYGDLGPGNKWTGLIGGLQRGEIDMAVAMLTMTSERAGVVDFLGPFMRSRWSILINHPPVASKAFKIYEPFDVYTWPFTCVCIGLTGLVMYLLNYNSPFSAWNMRLPGAISDEVSFVENMWFAMRSMLLQRESVLALHTNQQG
ncbi:hypothetical protein FGIG_06186, partial [Fasciola gigantica]